VSGGQRSREPLIAGFLALSGIADMLIAGVRSITFGSALSLQRTLEIGSYQTAWAMLHRLRSVLVRPSARGRHGRDLPAALNEEVLKLAPAAGCSFSSLRATVNSPAVSTTTSPLSSAIPGGL